jgi:hypothetical protein
MQINSAAHVNLAGGMGMDSRTREYIQVFVGRFSAWVSIIEIVLRGRIPGRPVCVKPYVLCRSLVRTQDFSFLTGKRHNSI